MGIFRISMGKSVKQCQKERVKERDIEDENRGEKEKGTVQEKEGKKRTVVRRECEVRGESLQRSACQAAQRVRNLMPRCRCGQVYLTPPT